VPRIAGYSGRGSLAAWVRVTAAREAVDLRKKLSAGGTALLPEHTPVATSDPELDLLRRKYGDVVRKAIVEAIRSLDPHEATVLRLFFLEGVKLESIASVYKTSERTARRSVANARQKTLDETRRLLGERVGGSITQLDSLIRLVQADLEPSLVKALRKAPKK
jgi:RNA polymerase sigma-70 factor (ECF subfamily)